VGYSVFGAEELNTQLMLLQNEGVLEQIMIDPSASGNLKPETSTSWNAGSKIKASEKLSGEVDAFRNDIAGLIETQPVAQKTNGQYVYSYLNLNKVFTQGIQADISFEMNKNISTSGGYQFLETGDKKVIEELREGKIFARDPVTSYSYKVNQENYGGLFNRSKHTFNIKLQYLNIRYHWDVSLRYVYRGKYGFGDVNGNTILDSPAEYVKGYGLINVAASKKLNKHFLVRAAVNNLSGYTNADNIPSLSGRTYFVSLLLNFNGKN
jgi:outer membrane receptor for ferrienterochelin and colicins